jgi:hypothetical protein
VHVKNHGQPVGVHGALAARVKRAGGRRRRRKGQTARQIDESKAERAHGSLVIGDDESPARFPPNEHQQSRCKRRRSRLRYFFC